MIQLVSLLDVYGWCDSSFNPVRQSVAWWIKELVPSLLITSIQTWLKEAFVWPQVHFAPKLPGDDGAEEGDDGAGPEEEGDRGALADDVQRPQRILYPAIDVEGPAKPVVGAVDAVDLYPQQRH